MAATSAAALWSSASADDDELLTMLRKELTTDEQRIFLDNFHTFLHNDPRRDFVVDLDGVYEWLGFTRKDNAKTKLMKTLVEDEDYKTGSSAFLQSQKCTEPDRPVGEVFLRLQENPSGRPSERILMTVHGFKRLCMAAGTEKASIVRDYYIAMEEVVLEYTRRKMAETTKQLEEHRRELQDHKRERQELLSMIAVPRLRKEPAPQPRYPLGDTVYIWEAGADDLKVGRADDMNSRKCAYRSHTSGGRLAHTRRCHNSKVLEDVVHHMLRHKVKNVTRKDWFGSDIADVVELIDGMQLLIDGLTLGAKGAAEIGFAARMREMLKVVGCSDEALARTVQFCRSGNVEGPVPPTVAAAAAAVVTPHSTHAAEADDSQDSDAASSTSPAAPPASAATHDAEYADGLQCIDEKEPEPSQASNAQDAGSLERFLAECFVQDPDGRVKQTDVVSRFRLWARMSVDKSAELRSFFSARLRCTMLYDPETRSNCQAYAGVRMLPMPPLPPLDIADQHSAFAHAKLEPSVVGRVSAYRMYEMYAEWSGAKQLSNEARSGLRAYLAPISMQTVVFDGARTRMGWLGITEKGALNSDGQPIGSRSKNRNRKAVQQLEVGTLRVLREFESVTHAAAAVGVSVSAVSSALSARKGCKGFMWRLAPDAS